MNPRGPLLGMLAPMVFAGQMASAQPPAAPAQGDTVNDLAARIVDTLTMVNAAPLLRAPVPTELEPELAKRTVSPRGPNAMIWRYLAVRIDPDRPLATRQIPGLEQALGTGNAEDSFLAAAALAWVGEWTIPVRERLLKAAFVDGAAVQREEALALIGSRGPTGEEFLPVLVAEYLAAEKAGDWDKLPPLTLAVWEILNSVPQVPALEVPSLNYDNAVRGVWLLSIQAEKGVAARQARERLINIAIGEEPASFGARSTAIRAIPQAITNEQEGLDILMPLLTRRRMQPLLAPLVGAIGDYGPFAEGYFDDLLPLIENDDVDLRAEVAAALFRICPTDNLALTLVIEMPEAQFGRFRSVILPEFAATYLDDTEIRDILRQTITASPLESEATLGAMSLQKRPRPDLVPDLLHVLERRFRTSREIELAGSMVARWQGQESLPTLLELLKSAPEWQARRALLGIVAEFDTPEVEDALVEARRDPSPYVRRSALELLAQRPRNGS